MKKETLKMVQSWFNGLNESNLESLLILFSNDSTIKNAANPVLSGVDAPRKLLETFFERTSKRFIYPMEITQNGNEVFAHWRGYYTFKSGIQIADITLDRDVTVPLRGVERFILDSDGKISHLDIVHETLSPLIYAKLSKEKKDFVSEIMAKEVIEQYFELEEIGDVEGVVNLCDELVLVVNAANPIQFGKEGARQYVQTFKNRTEHRLFKIGEISIFEDTAMVWWDAEVRFKSGIAFGQIISNSEFDALLSGVCRFRFSREGKITELDVFHETTSVPILASKTIPKI